MSPPVPVYSRAEIERRYQALDNPEKYNCLLKSITQHECTFRFVDDQQEVICLPFKRLFQRCLLPHTIKTNGKVTQVDRWTNIEITDIETNRDIVTDPKYAKDVDDFQGAEKEFRDMMWKEVEASG